MRSGAWLLHLCLTVQHMVQGPWEDAGGEARIPGAPPERDRLPGAAGTGHLLFGRRLQAIPLLHGLQLMWHAWMVQSIRMYCFHLGNCMAVAERRVFQL